jgi:hypothetical protein
MAKRRAAHTQADYERMLRAAIAVTGRPHVFRARPDGTLEVVPYGDDGDKDDFQLGLARHKVEAAKEPVL